MNDQSERLRLLRKDHLHMSQQEFADSLYMKRNSIAQFETGLRNPSERTLKTVSEVHNVNLDWLLHGEKPVFREVSREEEIATYMGDLLSSDDEEKEFQKQFIKMLSKLDVNDWKTIQKMVEEMTKEKD